LIRAKILRPSNAMARQRSETDPPYLAIDSALETSSLDFGLVKVIMY